MLKKVLFPLVFIAILFFGIPSTFAISETCNPAISCYQGDDYYANDCYVHIEAVSDCGSEGGWAFSCEKGCFDVNTGQVSNKKSGHSIDTSPKYDTPPVVEVEPDPEVISDSQGTSEPEDVEESEETKEESSIFLSYCPDGQILKSNGKIWLCANDNIGTPSSPLPSSCEKGQVVKWNDTGWVCADDNIVSSVNLLAFGLILLAILLLLKLF